jgi:DnaJ family protein A protein 2
MFFGGGFPGFGGHSASEHEESPGDVDNKEFYEILGVEQNASQDEVKKAYRKKVIKAHPDKGGDPEDFKKLQAAYEVISSPEKREIYDKYGIDGLREDGGSGMDPFESMFGGLFGRGRGGGRGQQQQQRKMKPVVKELKVTLEDVYIGKMKKVTYERQRNCSGCDGKGGKDAKKCGTCKGAGQVNKVVQLAPGFITQTTASCSTCKGEGTIYENQNKCKLCKGEKVKMETKTMEVPIEQGIPNEAPVQFSGEGHEMPDVMAGDFVVKITIEPHKRFERKGADLYITKKISLYEALTGCRFYLEHLDGKKLLITTYDNEIIAPGSKKQISGQGMPFYRDAMSHGNLYVTFDVEFPKANQLKNAEVLKTVLPVPKDLLVLSDEDKKKAQVLDDFDQDGVNSHAEGGKGRRGHHGHGHGDDDDDEEGHGQGGQRVQCNQQ